MLVKEILQSAYQEISADDADILLSYLLNQDKAWLHTHPDEKISKEVADDFNELVAQRKNHTPLAYILGYKEFYGRKFKVTKDTLVPRPETEMLVDIVLEFLKDKKDLTVVDVGTGSGCIGITLALENPDQKYLAVDISAKALEVAKENANYLKAKIDFKLSDLLTSVETADVVVANLPYLTFEQMSETSISKEPALALEGGKDGLHFYSQLLKQLKDFKLTVLEIDPKQTDSLEKEVSKNLPGRQVKVVKDLAGLDRFVVIT